MFNLQRIAVIVVNRVVEYSCSFNMITMNFRVTWAASESVDNHFKRAFQEERFRETQMYAQSYQDFMSIPENDGPMVDSHGRRLSYQRAVSGEDPMPSRYHDSSLKKKHSEKSEVSHAVIYKFLLKIS